MSKLAGRAAPQLFACLFVSLCYCRAVIHVIDASAEDPIETFRMVLAEMRQYNENLCRKPHVVALNKADLVKVGAIRSVRS